jgi:hypothetical protein
MKKLKTFRETVATKFRELMSTKSNWPASSASMINWKEKMIDG